MSTEILKGSGRGDPSIRITDVVDSRQLAFEQQRRAEKDAEIKALLEQAALAKARGEDRARRPPTPGEAALAEIRAEAWIAEMHRRREEPAELNRLQAKLERWAASPEVAAVLRSEPPAPTRYGKTLSPAELEHEAAVERAQARQQASLACRCGRYHSGDRCIYEGSW